jgi:hypothetical protein
VPKREGVLPLHSGSDGKHTARNRRLRRQRRLSESRKRLQNPCGIERGGTQTDLGSNQEALGCLPGEESGVRGDFSDFV